MDPERVHSYLQVACAGLGFDIGEVWWTSNQSGVSTVAAIEDKRDQNDTNSDGALSNNKKKLRFVQLYTSRSYADQRSKLVCPPSEGGGESGGFMPLRRRNSLEEMQQHVLSPQLVDAIANTTEVVWANCQKQEGLLGRSDVRLQTAVGMPVAMDSNGNMCVVVMFSPNNVQSTDEAMEYLQFISKSATSSSIPCLLPVFDSTHPSVAPITRCSSDSSIVTKNRRELVHHYTAEHLGEGVTARFVPFDTVDSTSENGDDNAVDPWAGIHTIHNLSDAPKDCFGIPMLPAFAELGNNVPEENPAGSVGAASEASEAFDEASYGVWTTVMDTSVKGVTLSKVGSTPQFQSSDSMVSLNHQSGTDVKIDPNDGVLVEAEVDVADSSRHSAPAAMVGLSNNPVMPPSKRVRLEEFCSAFLGMSVFDIADVWAPPVSDSFDFLSHVTSICSTRANDNLSNFKRVSGYTQIKVWSGAVGRAYASGNPVWSANQEVIVDAGRAAAFQHSKIQTALAVPIFSSGATSPSCVLCCYSLVRTDSVPFVLRFVQQALRLLWEGLDRVEPHESVGEKLWRDVAPADLGEMAADVEMQQAFLTKKKRPHDDMSFSPEKTLSTTNASDFTSTRDRSSSLSYQLEALEMATAPAPLQTNDHVAAQTAGVPPSAAVAPAYTHMNGQPEVSAQTGATTALQYHLQNAVRSIGDAVPWSHQHVATNNQGTKRAHVFAPAPSPEPNGYGQPVQQQSVVEHVPLQSLQQQPHILPMPGQPVVVQPFQQTSAFGSQTIQSQASQISYVNHFPNATQNGPSSSCPTIDSRNIQPMWQDGNGGIPYQVQSAPAAAAVPVPGAVASIPTVADGASGSMLLPTQSAVSGQEQMVFPDSIQSVPGQSCQPTGPGGSVAVPSMNMNGKPCRIQGCNEVAVSRRPYCLRHSGNRLCEHEGCTKCAQGSTRFCIAHGGGRRCTYPGCDKGARDKYFCAAHGGGKRCNHEGCSKSAVGGSNKCTSHGGGRRCSVGGCDKSAQSSTKFCVKHGGGKKCAHPNCAKVARGRTLYCAAHGGGVRCKLEGCNRVAIGKLQLCRTHGGGSRSRPVKTSPQLSPSTVIPTNIISSQPGVQI